MPDASTILNPLGRFASDRDYYPLGRGRLARYGQDLARTVPSMGYRLGFGGTKGALELGQAVERAPGQFMAWASEDPEVARPMPRAIDLAGPPMPRPQGMATDSAGVGSALAPGPTARPDIGPPSPGATPALMAGAWNSPGAIAERASASWGIPTTLGETEANERAHRLIDLVNLSRQAGITAAEEARQPVGAALETKQRLAEEEALSTGPETTLSYNESTGRWTEHPPGAPLGMRRAIETKIAPAIGETRGNMEMLRRKYDEIDTRKNADLTTIYATRGITSDEQNRQAKAIIDRANAEKTLFLMTFNVALGGQRGQTPSPELMQMAGEPFTATK